MAFITHGVETLRRKIHYLENNSELRNLISEEEEVVKAYEQLIRQNDDALKFSSKWAALESPEIIAILNEERMCHGDHNALYQDFIKQLKEYITEMKTLLSQREKLMASEKKLHEAQEKARKKHGEDTTAQTALNERDAIKNDMPQLTFDTIKRCTIKMATAYLTLYTNGANLMNKQIANINATAVQFTLATPPVTATAVSATQPQPTIVPTNAQLPQSTIPPQAPPPPPRPDQTQPIYTQSQSTYTQPQQLQPDQTQPIYTQPQSTYTQPTQTAIPVYTDPVPAWYTQRTIPQPTSIPIQQEPEKPVSN